MEAKKANQLSVFGEETVSYVYNHKIFNPYHPGKSDVSGRYFEFTSNGKSIVKKAWSSTYVPGQFILIEYSKKNPKICRIVRILSFQEYEELKAESQFSHQE